MINKYNNYNIIEIYIHRLSTTMQIFLAMNYLILMSEKYVHLRKRQKHIPRIFFSTRSSNWIHVTVCSYHVTYASQSESTRYSCLNVKELLARSRREIWSLIDCNWTRTHNYLVHKPTLDHSSPVVVTWIHVLRKYFANYVYLKDLYRSLILVRNFVWSIIGFEERR